MNQNTENSSLRIIDASFNRAMEGLRVIEECTRMHLNDSLLSRSLKDLRHHLASLIEKNFGQRLLTCRDILHDVGTDIQTSSEYHRQDLQQIVRANFGRTLQSLRSMEEFSKLIAPKSSAEFEQFRYRTYALEKAIVNLIESMVELENSFLYVLVDARSDLNEFESLVEQLIEAEVDIIQFREKRLDDRDAIKFGKTLSALTSSTKTRWIMNDRPDLAVLCNADGVHLGQTDMEVPSARRIVGSQMLIGVSTHNFEQATEAVLNGANYIGVGPMFPSGTKEFDKFASPEFVERVVGEIALPSFAIGGISTNNIGQLMDMGVRRIAISGAIVQSASPKEAAANIKAMLKKGN